MMTANIIAMYDWPKNENDLQRIIHNYLEFVIGKYPDMRLFLCFIGRNMKEHLDYLILFKKRLINLIGIELFKKLEMSFPEVLKIGE